MTTATESELPVEVVSSHRIGWMRMLAMFLLGLALALVISVGAVLAYEQAHAGRIGAGVHVGSVDVSGLTRDEAAARLTAAYASLGQGTLTLKVPDGTSTASYASLGRRLDVNAVVDAALAVGRTGNPLQRVSDEIRVAFKGTTIAPVVTFDQAALASGIGSVASAVSIAPVNATIKSSPTGYTSTASAEGRSLSESALASQVMTALWPVDAGAQQTLDISSDLVAIAPTFSSASAAQTAAAANADIAPIVLSHETDTWTIPAATVASWLVVTVKPGGTYDVQADPTKVSATLNGLATKINRKAVNATFLISKANKVFGVVAGKDGRTLDVAGSVTLIQGLLAHRATGVATTTLTPSVTTVAPALSTAAATSAAPQMRAISSWTTYYVPGAHNGNSANITIPAMAIDGTVVAPGAMFDFWKAVGTVSAAKGYKLGGAIINGHSVEGKTIGGGICSTSTTLFNAALRAGLETDARANHYYYISRYPLGLDATVWQDGSAVQDMSFTNDTPYPILIRTYARPGIVRFTLYSVPNGRTVSISKPTVKNFIAGYTKVEYTKALPPGHVDQVEYQANGQDVWVTVTVKDKSGKIISQKTYYSHYAQMIGIIMKGVS